MKCGECKHWHELENQKHGCREGKCDKVAGGTPFECDYGNKYIFSGITFDDEEYDDVFECFDELESEDTE